MLLQLAGARQLLRRPATTLAAPALPQYDPRIEADAGLPAAISNVPMWRRAIDKGTQLPADSRPADRL
jgi:hypothetical protein